MFAKLKRLMISILITLISISVFFGVILFFRWVGLKGLLGFAVGVTATGFLFMSKHPQIQVFKEMILK